ncbi:isoprenoid synthase domain-containing protein [Suillus discolor]|uniref:Terpene synthase n=1 Tax=Suillus discolor TaxID=1912936 RepID=A0A9P7F0C6_9AGAM|nr:isoprenoid synthase domain-containing protein [Suillus discolor]KAG2098250.1 isoprenoid synthase domain-containing protein [Suillus discolor]
MDSTATCTVTCSDSQPTEFILPDFFSDCPYPMRLNPHCDPVSRAIEQWLCSEAHLVEPEATKYTTILRPGYFASVCFPDADAFHLKVCADFLGWSFKMDDWLEIERSDVNDAWGVRDCCISAYRVRDTSLCVHVSRGNGSQVLQNVSDIYMPLVVTSGWSDGRYQLLLTYRDPANFQTERYSGKMCKSYFSRFKETGGPGCTERFIHGMDLWFISAAKEVENRAKGHINDVESYIELRRDLSGCKACFAFTEFACQIDLPDEVVSHPVIIALEEAANDFISWSNDIFSYNLEQFHHSTNNSVAVLMVKQGLDLQGAIDYCGRLCNISLQRFEENRANLPSWGEEIDKDVAKYVEGLQNWITGTLQWSFESARYFGKDAHIVKQNRIVKLLPKRPL